MSNLLKNKAESPIKILINLYSVVAGLASVTAIKFLVNPEENLIRNPFTIPIIDLFSFLTFFCYLIPFYQGAVTYLNKTYTREYEGKRGDILVDFLHLLGEGMVFFAMSASLSNIFFFILWLAVLIIIDTLWLSTVKLRRIEGPPDIWLILNLITFVFIIFFWLFHSIYPKIAEGLEGYTVLLFFSFLRTIYDYLRAYVRGKPFYF